MTKKLRCRICERFISLARLRRHPVAITCGGACQTENLKRVHRDHAMYSQRRKRAAEKEQAERTPETNGRAAGDTFLPRTWADAVAMLDRPVSQNEG